VAHQVHGERDPGSDARRAPSPVASPGRPAAHSPSTCRRSVEWLQRSAGNHAVARWLGRRPPVVQRFEGHEHESLGNITGADVDLGNGVVLTWGQVVAIAGDEFGTVEELRTAAQTPEGRRRIRAALEHDQVRGPIPASLEEQTDPELKKKEAGEQEGRFFTLLLDNVSHFAAGGDARATWRSHHGRALHKAFQAGLTGDDAAFKEAEVLEAFGQHFLTDMFSGGHIRTPRREVMDFFAEKADAMAGAFERNMRTRLEGALVSQVMQQLPPMLRGKYTQDKAREDVRATVDAKLEEGLAAIGGRAQLPGMFGKALAGAVSGAMHDRDGRQGVVVNSEDHPTPWLAKGDALLGESPESRDQAERAVLAAREELTAARFSGEREPIIDALVPADPPSVLHFAFDASDLVGPAVDAAAAAGAWLHAHPTDIVQLVGHTDPLGSAGYNHELGLRRANAVLAAVVAGGAHPGQVSATSQGKAALHTSDRKRYGENRRVELIWQSGANPAPVGPSAGPHESGPAVEKAQQALAVFGPPFAAVERYVPTAVEEMNEPLPEWRWGQMAPEMVAELDTWIRHHIGTKSDALLAKVPETERKTVSIAGDPVEFVFTPRAIAGNFLAYILANPARSLGELIGQPPGG